MVVDEPVAPSADDTIAQRTGETSSSAQVDTPDVSTRFNEKKRLHWAGKTCMYAALAAIERLTPTPVQILLL